MNITGISSADFGLVGHPLGHSFSKHFFTELFKEEQLDTVYENFDIEELTPEALYRLVVLNPKLRGFNVTAPYKIAIMDYLDEIDSIAKDAGAVNTVKVLRGDDGRLCGLAGYNTDVEGFKVSVSGLLDRKVERAIILGTGGASKAVAVALRSIGVSPVFVSRTKRSADTILYADIDRDLVDSCPLIVNATPAGTYPNTDSCPPFPYEVLTSRNFCHDLVYNPDETLFMRKSAAMGAKVKNGLEMLFNQAIASYKIWNTK